MLNKLFFAFITTLCSVRLQAAEAPRAASLTVVFRNCLEIVHKYEPDALALSHNNTSLKTIVKKAYFCIMNKEPDRHTAYSLEEFKTAYERSLAQAITDKNDTKKELLEAAFEFLDTLAKKIAPYVLAAMLDPKTPSMGSSGDPSTEHFGSGDRSAFKQHSPPS